MSYTAIITDGQSGETRQLPFDLDWDDTSDYLWSDGNWGCDCNRAQFFAKARGEEDPGRKCGFGRYRVTIEATDGAVLYADDPE